MKFIVGIALLACILSASFANPLENRKFLKNPLFLQLTKHFLEFSKSDFFSIVVYKVYGEKCKFILYSHILASHIACETIRDKEEKRNTRKTKMSHSNILFPCCNAILFYFIFSNNR